MRCSSLPRPGPLPTTEVSLEHSRRGREDDSRRPPAAAQPDPSVARLGQRVVAEFIGTALLLIAVIGSGIAAQNLSPGDTGLELLENAAATGAALVAIILAVGVRLRRAPESGGELRRRVLWRIASRRAGAYIVAQVAGAIVGVIIANLMFALPAVSVSTHLRSSPNLWFSEVIATFGLLLVIFGLTRGGRGAARRHSPSAPTSWARTSSRRQPALPIPP